jgi:hypothetical protein
MKPSFDHIKNNDRAVEAFSVGGVLHLKRSGQRPLWARSRSLAPNAPSADPDRGRRSGRSNSAPALSSGLTADERGRQLRRLLKIGILYSGSSQFFSAVFFAVFDVKNLFSTLAPPRVEVLSFFGLGRHR